MRAWRVECVINQLPREHSASYTRALFHCFIPLLLLHCAALKAQRLCDASAPPTRPDWPPRANSSASACLSVHVNHSAGEILALHVCLHMCFLLISLIAHMYLERMSRVAVITNVCGCDILILN